MDHNSIGFKIHKLSARIVVEFIVAIGAAMEFEGTVTADGDLPGQMWHLFAATGTVGDDHSKIIGSSNEDEVPSERWHLGQEVAKSARPGRSDSEGPGGTP